MTAAETHLDGLTALIANSDALQSWGIPSSEKDKDEEAILQRYILFCIMEVARIKFSEENIDLGKADASFGAVMPLHKLSDRLSGFWIIPYFLAADDLTCAEVDGAKHLNNLRFLTATYGGCRPSSLPTGLRNCPTEKWGTRAEGIMSYFSKPFSSIPPLEATSRVRETSPNNFIPWETPKRRLSLINILCLRGND